MPNPKYTILLVTFLALPFFGCKTIQPQPLRENLRIVALENTKTGFFLTLVNPSTRSYQVELWHLPICLTFADFQDTNGSSWLLNTIDHHPIFPEGYFSTVVVPAMSTNRFDVSSFIDDPPFELVNSKLIQPSLPVPQKLIMTGMFPLIERPDIVIMRGHYYDKR